MTLTRSRAAVFALAAVLVACRGLPAQEPPAPLGPGDHEVGLRHGGLDRYYLVHVPAPAPGREGPRPLVLLLHGGGGDPEGMERYGMLPVADREGFVLVRPAGSGRLARRLLTWNAGTCCGWAQAQGVDDVGFLRAVVADVSSRTPVDRARVYAAGHSNGGMMAHRLAAEAGDLVAAICAVGGAMVCEPPRAGPPVPVLQIHSQDDPRALYDGGLGPPFPLTNHRVQHPPVKDTLDDWIAHDGCPAEARREPPATSPEGHTAERLTWGPGRGGAEVVHWRLKGPGHGWPGAPASRLERLIGPSTTVIDASEEAWAFFRRFSREERRPERR